MRQCFRCVMVSKVSYRELRRRGRITSVLRLGKPSNSCSVLRTEGTKRQCFRHVGNLTCLNREYRRPGTSRFGPSAWKAEQLLAALNRHFHFTAVVIESGAVFVDAQEELAVDLLGWFAELRWVRWAECCCDRVLRDVARRWP